MSIAPIPIQSESTDNLNWLTIEQWQEFVETFERSSNFHDRRWIELIQNQYGFTLHIPALVKADEILAALPLFQTRSLSGKRKLISLPFTDYLPVLSKSPSYSNELARKIQTHFGNKYHSIILKTDCPIPSAENQSHQVVHVLRTDRPLKEVESEFANPIKVNLRKAKRRGLDFQIHTDRNAMDTFSQLHTLTRRKLGVPVQPWSYFERLQTEIIERGMGNIGIVTKQNRPIAAGVLLSSNRRLIYKYAASNPDALADRPNDWLVYHCIKMAVDTGHKYFDFGISEKSQEGLRRFKKKWGAVESDVFHNYLAGSPEVDTDPSTVVRVAGEVIKRTPTIVCKTLGRVLYKYSQ
ncbi:GNAT family N-acetyltransferase [bacterium]|nr:GNAT family N-acetyltransferase [bacterium]MDA7904257.1 GNAT family N-acetyltransferase [bacterium]MDA7905992.1 GNAT family N-acetyltransferase [Mariniblastus sp.]